MYRGIEILITELKNNSDIYAYVQDRIYHQDIATIGDPQFPCIIIGIDDDERIEPKIHKAILSITIYSKLNYEECEKILDLLVGQDAHTTLPILHKRRYTNINNNYTAYFQFSRGGARVAEQLDEDGTNIVYSLSSEWLMFGGH